MTTEEKRPFEELFQQLTEQAAKHNAQVLVVAAYPQEDAEGNVRIMSERLNLLNPEVHEASAAWLMPILQYLDIYFRDRPPTDADYAMFNQIMISRKMENMTEEEAAAVVANVQARSQCPECGKVGCTDHKIELN